MKDTSAIVEAANAGKSRQIVVSGHAHSAAKEMAQVYGKDMSAWVSEIVLAAREAAPPEIDRAIKALKRARASVGESESIAQVTR
jgi:hypothetical protein